MLAVLISSLPRGGAWGQAPPSKNSGYATGSNYYINLEIVLLGFSTFLNEYKLLKTAIKNIRESEIKY
jgi:hypothetical protein